MPRRRAISSIVLICGVALAAGLAGCSSTSQLFEDANNQGNWLTKPLKAFSKPDWAVPISRGKTVSLGPSGPVALEDLVGADGRCAPPVAEAAQAAPAPAVEPAPAVTAATAPPPPADRPVGSFAGDLAGPPMPAAPPPPPSPAPPVAVASANSEGLEGLQPGGPQVIGGIALGMTECEAVRRAGQPNDVSIGADAKGERRVVLSYLTGSRPGIYTFSAGRLKEIDRAPGQPAPEKPTKKRAKKKLPRDTTAAQRPAERVTVQ